MAWTSSEFAPSELDPFLNLMFLILTFCCSASRDHTFQGSVDWFLGLSGFGVATGTFGQAPFFCEFVDGDLLLKRKKR